MPISQQANDWQEALSNSSDTLPEWLRTLLANPAVQSILANVPSPATVGGKWPLANESRFPTIPFTGKMPVQVPLAIREAGSETFYDTIEGLNVGHAMAAARNNWPGMIPEQIGSPIPLGLSRFVRGLSREAPPATVNRIKLLNLSDLSR
jgi:hypothetical protein